MPKEIHELENPGGAVFFEPNNIFDVNIPPGSLPPDQERKLKRLTKDVQELIEAGTDNFAIDFPEQFLEGEPNPQEVQNAVYILDSCFFNLGPASSLEQISEAIESLREGDFSILVAQAALRTKKINPGLGYAKFELKASLARRPKQPNDPVKWHQSKDKPIIAVPTLILAHKEKSNPDQIIFSYFPWCSVEIPL
jgi:hypothetical protein